MNTMVWFEALCALFFVFLSLLLKLRLAVKWLNRLLLGLLRQKNRVDVRQDTTGGDRHRAQELGEFFVVADGELNVARHNSGLLVVAGSVASEFKNFSREVFKHRREVHRRASADSGRVLTDLQVARNTANRELKSRLGGSAHGLLAGLTLSSSRHC